LFFVVVAFAFEAFFCWWVEEALVDPPKEGMLGRCKELWIWGCEYEEIAGGCRVYGLGFL
jgi:hypothetical protein